MTTETKWYIYIPGEGHWPINYTGDSKAEAKATYLRDAKRKTLPVREGERSTIGRM